VELISHSYVKTFCVKKFILFVFKITAFFFTSKLICHDYASYEAIQIAMFILYL